MKIILFTTGILMIAATLLPLVPKDNWWIRGFDFPRLQISTIIAVTLAGYFIYWNTLTTADIVLIFLLLGCLVFQCYMILPYTFLAQKQVKDSENPGEQSSLSIICTNVLMTNRRSSELREILRNADPDIILALETDKWWLNELKEFEETYPHVVKKPLDNLYGMALYSKHKLIDPKIKFLVQDDVPSIHSQVKLASGVIINLHCLHPRPPFITGSEKSTERDAELLIVGKQIKDIEKPTVVLGDLNDVAWSRTNYLFQDISGLLDPRVGRGFFNTFHAKYPFFRFPLDHCFHSNHFKLINFKRLEYFGSDHFPVYIELSIEADAHIKQEELEADENEKEKAEEKIKEGKT